MISSQLPRGKIDPDILHRFLSRYVRGGDRVLIGAAVGEDAAVIDMGEYCLIVKTDPITHVTGGIGHYAVNVNANDIAAMGGVPRWFLATILLPPSAGPGDAETIFAQISESCNDIGVAYCGGHTEVTGSVSNPLVIGQMIGEASRADLKPTSGARPGDELIMTKRAAIEATAIIALEKEEELRGRLPEELLSKARNYLNDPGISVLKEAALVRPLDGVHALHDPTEGGIATGVFEMATASRLGVRLHNERISIAEETRLLCEIYGVDPLGAFASGSLLIAVSPSGAGEVLRVLKTSGIEASSVGAMTPEQEGMKLVRDSRPLPLPVYGQDELSRIFG
ncbi:MAG: hypothetical protein JW821_16315 [Deltaproteobacteria bacterium]|nr:hypothetical protein [Deltaproteobacteria bacterium]